MSGALGARIRAITGSESVAVGRYGREVCLDTRTPEGPAEEATAIEHGPPLKETGGLGSIAGGHRGSILGAGGGHRDDPNAAAGRLPGMDAGQTWCVAPDGHTATSENVRYVAHTQCSSYPVSVLHNARISDVAKTCPSSQGCELPAPS